MRHTRLYTIGLFLFLLMGGCSIKGIDTSVDTEPFLGYPAINAGLYDGPAIVVHQGDAVYTWYDPARTLMMAAKGGTVSVSEGSPSPSLHSFNVLHTDGHSLYMIWRPKGEKGKGWKYILFRASRDRGKTLTTPVILNNGDGAMEPTSATSDKGDVYVAWFDERSGKYDIYMNISHDYGMTWSGENRMNTENPPGTVNSMSPKILTSGDHVWIIWIDSHKKTGGRLIFRSSTDAGRTWNEPRFIAEKENFYNPKIMMVNARLVIIWSANDPLNDLQYMVKGIYSDDLGRTWHALGDIKLRSWIHMDIHASADASGSILMALAVRDKEKIGIDNIYFVMSSDKGQVWSEPVRLQINTPHHTVGNLPRIASDSAGRIFVTWVDYRNIRGNIYANFSKDRGKTWLRQDLCLSAVNRNAALPRIATNGKGKFYVVWLDYTDDLMEKAFVKVKEVEVK